LAVMCQVHRPKSTSTQATSTST